MGRLARRFNSLIACFLCASWLTVVSGQSPSPQFEVASIKRNVTGEEMMTFRTLPDGGVQMSNITVQLAISRAYPELYAVANVPAWATSERYDIVARGPAGASAAITPAMLRTLFADRLKLRAHVEQREEPAYNLVIANANGRLGPALNPSRLDCASAEPPAPNAPIPTIPTPEEARARCGGSS